MSKQTYVLVRQSPRSEEDDDDEELVYVPDLTVYDTTPERVDTGLIAPTGEAIYKVTREPIGFLFRE